MSLEESSPEPPVDVSTIDTSVVADPTSVLEPAPVVPAAAPVVSKKDMLLLDIITQEYLVKKNFKVPKKLFNMFNVLVQKDKTCLLNIDNLFKQILEDKKVNTKDIPQIILVIQELYKFFKSVYFTKIDPTDCGTVLQLILFLLASYRLDEDPDKEAVSGDILKIMDTIINSCIELIVLKDKVPTSLLRKLFVCF
jgi:hypothetical protein